MAALPGAPFIAVTGDAQLKVAPDTANISFQVVSIKPTAQEAKQKADQQVSLILTLLKEAGFDSVLLTRADIQLRPQFEYIDKKRQQVGIKASRQLSYQLDELSKVNLFLESLVKAKVTHLGRINYALKEPEQWQIKARDMAVEDSKQKAQGLANSYQAELGKIYSINYQNQKVQPIMMRAMESEPITPVYLKQDIVINERVDAVFLLND